MGKGNDGCVESVLASSVYEAGAHVEFWQVMPLPHDTPQAPQLFGSLVVSVQVPLQLVPPLAHGPPGTHAPAWHVVPLPQTTPQAPQLLLSPDVSVHTPPQEV